MDPHLWIGKQLDDPAVPTPAVVLDRAAVVRNCAHMRQAAQALGLGWRAHIKTHKTTEVTRFMVGEDGPAQLVVSTLLEAEQVLQLLLTLQAGGRPVNLLYGFPLYTSAVARLAAVARALGPGGVSVLVDHAEQVPVAQALAAAVGGDGAETAANIGVFVKFDMGSARAGVVAGTAASAALVQAVLAATTAATGALVLQGLYCHAGHSYDARQPWASMAHLVAEFTALGVALKEVQAAAAAAQVSLPVLTLSVGASPTVATLQHPDLGGTAGGNDTAGAGGSPADRARAAGLRATLDTLRHAGNVRLEAHAGVYPLRDLQQLATHCWAGAGATGELADLALTVLADVASIYAGRGRAGTDEVLINAGCLALSREVVKPVALDGPVYGGDGAYGIVMPWPAVADDARLARPGAAFPLLPSADSGSGWWQVARISQEHGILTWTGPTAAAVTPPIGQRVRIWPNHACITVAPFAYFLVVEGTEIVDVWVRWRGW